jgi:hypothetical protein
VVVPKPGEPSGHDEVWISTCMELSEASRVKSTRRADQGGQRVGS